MVKEKILSEIVEAGKIETAKLERSIVQIQRLCSKATFYRKINELRIERRIKQDGIRESEVYPA